VAAPDLDVGLGSGFTLEGWIQPDDLGNRPIILWMDGNGGGGVQLYSSVPLAGGGAGSLFANPVDSAGNSHLFSTPPGILRQTVFQHVALTYDRASGLARLYAGGALVASQDLGFFTPRTSSHLYFGYNPSSGASFKGRIDDVAIYDRALTSEEIEILVTAEAAAKCAAPPSALARF